LAKVRFLPFHKGLYFSLLYLAPTLTNGIAAGLVSYGILGSFEFRKFVIVASAYAIAGAIGTLAVFAPSGIGVREGVFVAILVVAGFLPIDAIIISILARFISTLSDLFVVGVFVFESRNTKLSP
jgi:uncharacterized membrane protein YbhN (UPF0104 family)